MKIILFANTSWYLYNFRLDFAKTLRGLNHDVLLISPKDRFTEKLINEGFHWRDISLSRSGINPFNEIRSINNIFKIYKSEKPELIHQFTLKPAIYGSLSARSLGIKKIVNSITGLGSVFASNRPLNLWLQKIIGLMFRLTISPTQVILQNEEDYTLFAQNHWASKKTIYLIRSSGVDINKFYPHDNPSKSPVLIALPARMLKSKGVFEFVKAIRQIKSRGIDCLGALVGDNDIGNPDSIPTEQLKEWSKNGDVEWWGWQDDMTSVFSKAHIICLPSFYREGIPLVLLEAAASGLPIVTTDIPGCREIVRHQVNGLIVPPQNAYALAEALSILIQDEDIREKMGKAGRALVKAEFSREKVNQETLELYFSDKIQL